MKIKVGAGGAGGLLYCCIRHGAAKVMEKDVFGCAV